MEKAKSLNLDWEHEMMRMRGSEGSEHRIGTEKDQRCTLVPVNAMRLKQIKESLSNFCMNNSIHVTRGRCYREDLVSLLGTGEEPCCCIFN